MNTPDEAAKGAPGAPPIIAELKIRIEKDLGIRINDLSDLKNPNSIAAAADHLCSDKSRYLEPNPPLDNLSSLVFNIINNGEIGQSPSYDNAQQLILWRKLKEAAFSHIRPFAILLMMELANRCHVPTDPPLSLAQWKAHLERATNTTAERFRYKQSRKSKNLVVEAVDILLHAPPESRSEMLKTLIAEARNAFGKLTYEDSGKPLDGWVVIYDTEQFSQEIIENLVLRAPESLSGPADDTKRKVRGALGEDEGKAA